jgi:predicted DNA-binding transcriptional regulator AlpA
MPIDQYIRLKKLARLLDVHPKTIQRWSREGRFPAPTYVGGEPRWKESEVLVYLETHKTAPPEADISGTEGSGREHLGTSAPKGPKRG